jgi:hypothetical protein
MSGLARPIITRLELGLSVLILFHIFSKRKNFSILSMQRKFNEELKSLLDIPSPKGSTINVRQNTIL